MENITKAMLLKDPTTYIVLLTILMVCSIYLVFKLRRRKKPVKNTSHINEIRVFAQRTTVQQVPELSDPGEKFQLSANQSAMTMKLIRGYMEQKKPYLDHDFKMSTLCDALKINRTYLSEVINRQTGQRFESFVNAYRIAYAVKLIAADHRFRSHPYTLEYYSSKSGFASKSTFNRAFKEFTNINPSFFQRVILRNEESLALFLSYLEELNLTGISIMEGGSK